MYEEMRMTVTNLWISINLNESPFYPFFRAAMSSTGWSTTSRDIIGTAAYPAASWLWKSLTETLCCQISTSSWRRRGLGTAPGPLTCVTFSRGSMSSSDTPPSPLEWTQAIARRPSMIKSWQKTMLVSMTGLTLLLRMRWWYLRNQWPLMIFLIISRRLDLWSSWLMPTSWPAPAAPPTPRVTSSASQAVSAIRNHWLVSYSAQWHFTSS